MPTKAHRLNGTLIRSANIVWTQVSLKCVIVAIWSESRTSCPIECCLMKWLLLFPQPPEVPYNMKRIGSKNATESKMQICVFWLNFVWCEWLKDLWILQKPEQNTIKVFRSVVWESRGILPPFFWACVGGYVLIFKQFKSFLHKQDGLCHYSWLYVCAVCERLENTKGVPPGSSRYSATLSSPFPPPPKYSQFKN